MTTLTLTRQIAASPATVWRCLTEPELLKQWFCPKPVTLTEVTLDLTPGGGFRTVMNIPDHGEIDGGYGCVLLVEPHKRLIWTSALGPKFYPVRHGDGEMEFPMTAEMTLQPSNGGCLYTASAYHATDDDTAKHEKMGFHDGWGAAADQLRDLAQSL